MHIAYRHVCYSRYRLCNSLCTLYTIQFPFTKKKIRQPEEKKAQEGAYRYYERLQCVAVETVSEIRFKQ